jgi:hypothetical protein
MGHRLHRIALGDRLHLDAAQVERLVREHLQRNCRIEPRRQRRARELQDRRADVRADARIVGGRLTAELHGPARLLPRADRELLTADLDGPPRNHAGDVAEPTLERGRLTVRHLHVAPFALSPAICLNSVDPIATQSAGDAGNLMQG